jgi:outer membrane cobalamin receptor
VILQPIDSLRWAFDGQWVSETFDEQIPVGPGIVDGYSIFGTALTLDLGTDWQLQARVDNLTDEEYETFLGFPGPARGFRAGVRYRRSRPVGP